MKIIVSPVDYNHDETAIKFNLMVGPTGEEQKTYIENIKQYK